MSYWKQAKALFKRKQLDRDLEDELAFHLALKLLPAWVRA